MSNHCEMQQLICTSTPFIYFDHMQLSLRTAHVYHNAIFINIVVAV